jgi:putative aldouronate transport system substrate-binding protein
MKMKKYVKVIAILLIALFLVAACGTPAADVPEEATQDTAVTGNGAAQDTQVPVVGEEGPLGRMPNPITIRVGTGFGLAEGAVPPGTTPQNMMLNDLLADLFDIHLEWLWAVPVDQAEDRLQLALATSEVPDIMSLENPLDFFELAEFGQLRDLRGAMDIYLLPEIREMFRYFNDAPLDIVTVNGELLAIPRVVDSFQFMPLIWYRYDWVQELNLSVPTNMDEFHAMLQAFVDNNMGGPNTVGISMFGEPVHWAPDARAIFQGYGSYPETWVNRGGELVYGTVQPETQQALLRLRQMYADGILNPEFGVMNVDMVVEEIVADRVGAVSGEWWLPNWPLNDHLEYNPDAIWRGLPIVTPDGSPGIVSIPRNNIHEYHVVSVNAPAGAEEALMRIINLRWAIDYWPDALERFDDRILPESGYVYNWGPGRVLLAHEQYVNFVALRQAIETGNTDHFTSSQQWDLWLAYQIIEHGYQSDVMSYPQAWGLHVSRVAEAGGWETNMYIRDNNLFIFNEFYGEPTPTEIARSAILQDMWLEFYVNFVMGNIPESDWYDFVDNWHNLGGTDWSREVNEQFRAMQ